MKKPVLFLVFILPLFLSAQKKYMKQASAYEKEGLFEQAAEKYMQAYHVNATKPEIIKGLNRTSQKVVDNMLSEFFIAKNSGNTSNAIQQFDLVLEYKEELTYFNIAPNIPGYYYDDYDRLKNDIKAESRNREVNERAAKVDSLYNYGVTLYRAERWLDAWDQFNNVQQLNGDYKDAKKYKEDIESKATSLSVILNNKNRFSEVELFKANINAELAQLNNPLMKMIDRDNLNQIIEEQKFGLSGVIDERSAARLGKILGVESMMLVNLIGYDYVPGEKIRTQKTAYRAKAIQINQYLGSLGAKKEADYVPESYVEYANISRLLVTLQYQLIDTETAEILAADIVREELLDENVYAEYNGNYLNLYPSDGTNIHTSGPVRDKFLLMFTTKRASFTEKEMEFKAQEVLAKKMAQSLDDYFRQ